MPELPEVETIRRQLQAVLSSSVIVDARIIRSDRESPSGDAFVQAVKGRRIMAVERRAKLLIWRFDDGTALLAHLKMTGRFVFVSAGDQPTLKDRIEFIIDRQQERHRSMTRRLLWSDARRFGYIRVCTQQALDQLLSDYGPEPLLISTQDLAACLMGASVRPIKTCLLDQTRIAGIGNIYADEACHHAGILPRRRLASLRPAERLRLAQAIQEVLQASIDRQGTSARDYVDVNGTRGGFLSSLRVYGRSGKPCYQCGTAIKKIFLGQRGTHYCPKCQR